MANIAPAGNVQIATVAGFISVVIEHMCKANNIVIPDDVASGLPGIVAVGVAWVCDIITENRKSQDVQACAVKPPV